MLYWYVHVHVYTVCTYKYIRAVTNVGKQASKLCWQKIIEDLKVHACFYQCCLIGYRKPPKLDYYFITRTILLPVAVSTTI